MDAGLKSAKSLFAGDNGSQSGADFPPKIKRDLVVFRGAAGYNVSPQNGGEVETITDILPYDGEYALDLKNGSFAYRVIAECDDGNRVEYGFIGKWSCPRGNQNRRYGTIRIED